MFNPLSTQTEPKVNQETGIPTRVKVKRDMFWSYMANGIPEEDLHFFIEEYIGINVPQKSICPHHVAPFEFIKDAFYDKFKTILLVANRGGGKTTLLSILNFLDVILKSQCFVANAGATISQANRGYEYFKSYIVSPPFDKYLAKKPLQSHTELINGSVLEILVGSEAGLRGPHPNKARIDEVELMGWPLIQTAMSMSRSSKGVLAQDIFASTRQMGKGTVQRLMNEAEERNIKTYIFCIWEVVEKCERKCKDDSVYGDCSAYAAKDVDGNELIICGGKAHDCSGFYKIEDFIKKVSNLDYDTLDSEWFCNKPSGGTRVYGRYFKNVPPFLMSPSESKNIMDKIQKEKWQTFSAIDFGTCFRYMKFAIDPRYTDDPEGFTVYLIYTYWTDSDTLIDEYAENIKTSPFWYTQEICFRDPSAKQEGLELKSKGIITRRAINSVLMGIKNVKAVMKIKPKTGLPGFRVLHGLGNQKAVEEIYDYSHPTSEDGKPDFESIIKVNDHCPDVIRYAIHTWIFYYSVKLKIAFLG